MTENLILRRANFAPSSYDPETRTIESVLSTGSTVRRRDHDEALDFGGLDMSTLDGAPVLDGHQRDSARNVLGRVVSARLEGGKLIGVIRFSDSPDVDSIVARVRDGTLTDVSIGLTVRRWGKSKDPATGREVRTARDWSVFEVSVVPIGADPGAKFRGKEMPDQIEDTEDTVVAMPEPDQARIRSMGELADLPPSWAEGQIEANASLEDARRSAREELGRRARPNIRSQQARPAEDATVRLRGMEDALALRAGLPVPDDRMEAAHAYRGHSLRDLARETLVNRGVSVTGMGTDEVFRAAMHTVSDFPNLLTGTGRRVLLASYEAAASPLKTISRQGSRTDFRPGSTLRLGEMGALSKVSESGEIKSVSRAEAAASYAPDTFASIYAMSRKALINDDLGAFNDFGRAAGQAAAQTEANLLHGLLTQSSGVGPVMGDGKTLFHDDHGNLLDAAALSVESLSDARLALRQQTGLDGKTPIHVVPKFLLVGPELETLAEQVLATLNATTVADVNPFSGRLTLLVEPRIQDGSWYVFADPGQLPVLEYSYLASAPGPQMSSRDGWEVLSTEFRVVLDFGAGAIDWRGAVRNPGE